MENYWIFIAPTLTVLGGLAYFGMKSYIGEKLKNIATHEDIGRITNQVESVKQVFTSQTEKLKQELSVLTNKENVLFNEEKEALIAYLGAWNIWYSSLKIMISDATKIHYKDTNDLINKLEDLSNKEREHNDRIEICMSKLELFLNNDEILKSIGKLNQKTEDLHILNTEFIDFYMWNNLSFNTTLASIIEKKEDALRDSEKDKLTFEENREKMKNKEHEYASKKPLILHEIFIQRNEFIDLSRKYIRQGVRKEYSH